MPLSSSEAFLWTNWLGLSFSTGPQVYTISSLTLAPFYAYEGTQNGTITAELFAAGGDYKPTGSALAVELCPSSEFGATPAARTVSFTNTFSLNANSSYVLKLSNSIGSGAKMGGSSPSDGPLSTGTSGLTYNGRVFYSSFSGSVLGPFATTPWLKLEGDVSSPAVPEPSQVAYLLLLASVGGYVAMKRRKAAKPAVATLAA